MTKCFLDFLKKQDVEFKEWLNIKSISSIGIGGRAKIAVLPKNEAQLIETVRFLFKNGMEYKIIGNATNVLFPDTDFSRVLILTRKINIYRIENDVLYAPTGTHLSAAIREIAGLGYTGLDELYGIPGSIGGAVYGNAGAYGKSVSDVIEAVRVYAPETDEIQLVAADDMKFSYRTCALKYSGKILLSANIKLCRDSAENVCRRLATVIAKRKSSQPSGRSLGSIFKRYNGIPVSKLIDELGMKGLSVGGAVISEKHAGFILNVSGASAHDVCALISEIKSRIYRVHGFIPEEEIEIL